MARYDQIRFCEQLRIIAMHVETFLHELLSSVHKSTVNQLAPIVLGVIKSKSLKLSVVGRELGSTIQERSGIRKMDRCLSNSFLQEASGKVIYEKICQFVIGKKKRPHIIVDWSKQPNGEGYILRASLSSPGRAVTLYEEIHPKKKEGNAKVHRLFLEYLKLMLPEDCKPIIITDAGFKNPWFQQVLRHGWNFIGRVRGKIQYASGKGYRCIDEIKFTATEMPEYLGTKILTKKNPLRVGMYTYKEKLQGRKKKTRSGKKCIDKDSKNYGRSRREGWILVSSIKRFNAAEKIVKIYKNRMRIEEAFRDLKSSQYGLSMEENKTLNDERRIVWLMIAALATLIAYIVGYIGEQKKLHRQFQANSTHDRRVLSFFYLGCQIIRKTRIKIHIDLKSCNALFLQEIII